MEDFNALATSLGTGMADVRGCLILSSDGLVLGAHPAEAERTITPAWVRFAAIGDPERGFAQFGTETLCYVRRGPYAGFAVAGPGARPGLMIAHMEQVLLAAEESRWRDEWLRGTEAATVAPQSKPSSFPQLEHPAPDPLVIDVPAPVVLRSTSEPSEEVPPLRRPEPAPVDKLSGNDAETAERPVDRFAGLVSGDATEPDADPFDDLAGDSTEPDADRPWEPTPPEPLPDPLRWSDREPGADAEPQLEPVDEADEGSGADPETGPGAGVEPADQAEEEDDDVDRFSLAREFGRLLQRGEGPADG